MLATGIAILEITPGVAMLFTELGPPQWIALLSHSVVVSTLDMLSGDLGSLPGGCNTVTVVDKLVKQDPMAGICEPAT